MRLLLDLLIHSLSDKESAQGFAGLSLMISSTFIANFSFIIGALTAIGGLVLVCLNIKVKYEEYYKIKKKNDFDDQDKNYGRHGDTE